MKRTLPVIGMACASCSAHVERTLNGLRGVQSASVSLASRTALIDYDPSAITLEEMKAAINGIGFDLVIEADRSVEAIERRAYVRLPPPHAPVLALRPPHDGYFHELDQSGQHRLRQ